MKNVPKKKKRKAGKYVEPGSSRGLLLTIFAGLVAFGCYRYQPWKDDWELVRALFGQGRRHELAGQWDIVKTVTVKPDAPRVLSQAAIQSGMLQFSKKGAVKMVFASREGKATAQGKYRVSGQLLALNDLASSSDALGLPNTLKMQLAWTGPNQLVAALGTEAVYLKKRDEGHPIKKLMKMVGSKDPNQAPGEMRGVIATMEDNLRSAERN